MAYDSHTVTHDAEGGRVDGRRRQSQALEDLEVHDVSQLVGQRAKCCCGILLGPPRRALSYGRGSALEAPHHAVAAADAPQQPGVLVPVAQDVAGLRINHRPTNNGVGLSHVDQRHLAAAARSRADGQYTMLDSRGEDRPERPSSTMRYRRPRHRPRPHIDTPKSPVAARRREHGAIPVHVRDGSIELTGMNGSGPIQFRSHVPGRPRTIRSRRQ
jgi:hypothetical protein